jgi:cell wall-associated NlpC family hydrolase
MDVRTVRGAVSLAAVVTALAVILPGGASDAQTAKSRPSLSALVAEATHLSNEVDSLGQQFDGLRIQISHAETEERFAKLAASRAAEAMTGSQQAVAQLAAMGYMNQGLDPTLEMLTNGNPGQFLNQAATVQELDNQAGMRLSTLQKAQLAAARAQATAKEQIVTVDQLQTEINSKVSAIHAKLAVLDSSEMSQALAIFQQTGQYPDFTPPTGDSAEAIALRYALTRRGDPYVWAAAGPSEFDCSGLIVWAYAQEGIALPHYTGSLWNSGLHVSRADLQPGDLVFFFPDISHVGMYIGNGLMVDAPSTGQVVQVQSVFWNEYVGAVRIS